MKHANIVTTILTSFLFVTIVAIVNPTYAEDGPHRTVELGGGVQYQVLQDSFSSDAGAQSDKMFYRVSVDGGKTYGRPKTQDPLIRLRALAFDPLTLDEDVPAEGNHYLVQLEIQPVAAFRERMEMAGGRVIGFIPPQTYIVRATDEETVVEINQLPFVRWTGPYTTAYKTAPEVVGAMTMDGAFTPTRYMIGLFSRAGAAVDSVVEQVRQVGGAVVERSRVPSHFIEAELTAGQLARVLEHDNVEFVDLWTPPESDLDIVREASGANFLELQVPFYTGNGVVGEVLDRQLRVTHQGFAPPIEHGEVVSQDGHGTRVYGIVFGNGSLDSQARGLLPTGTGIYADRLEVSDRAAHTAELVDAEGPFRAVFQTNSWGHSRTTAYNIYSSQLDEIIFDNDLLITQSQSNANDPDPRNSRPEAWAKNVVAVGGVQHFNSLDYSEHVWEGIASIGPAEDGRVKPDLSHFYDAIYTAGGPTDTSHTQFGGTSASTPMTAGHFGLVFQMWSDGIFTGTGTPGSGTDVFAARPHSTTARALVINAARQYAFNGEEHDLTRVHQGWGLANVENIYNNAAANGWKLPLVIDEQDPIEDQETQTYLLQVADGESQSWLKATMVYLDPPGSPAADIATINDLSLRLISPDGTVYWGNAGLLAGNWSVSGGSPSTVDTVENVFIEQAMPGRWTLEVVGDRIVEDARLETPEVDADFALVVTCAGANQCEELANVPPEVEIVSPAAGATIKIDENTLVEVDARDFDGSVVEVEFFADDIPVGTATSAPYEVTWVPSVVGEVILTAVATDDDGIQTTSDAVPVEVLPIQAACTYQSSEWPGGFDASIEIANHGTEPIEGWEVRWEYPEGVEVTRYWNAELTGSNPFIATPVSWNATIQPGDSVRFGLLAEKAVRGSPAPEPELGGETCSE